MAIDRLILDNTAAGAAGAALVIGSFALHGTFNPTSSFWGKVIWHAADKSRHWVSLTFDDGPTEGSTERILDLLGELQVPAAFFVIGRNLARWPDLVRRMDDEGHLVANHTMDHGHFDLFRGRWHWKRQVEETNDRISQIIGKKPAFFRPPMGFTTLDIHRAARRAGQTVVTWSRGARDGLHSQTAAILARTLTPAQTGDIIMLHDGVDPHLRESKHQDRRATINALTPLIAGLRQRQLVPVRLDQLLGISGYLDVAGSRGQCGAHDEIREK